MTNAGCRMPKEIPSINDESWIALGGWRLDLGFGHSLVIRHSPFVISLRA